MTYKRTLLPDKIRKSMREWSPRILMQARNPAILAEELENAINEQRLEDALKGYENYKQLEDFPRKSLVNKLISVLAYAGDLK